MLKDYKKLVFMYIEKAYGFFKQGFNFSTKEQFYVHEGGSGQLQLRKNSVEEKIPVNFWGDNISEINIFVGKNGSGKTTLMRIMCQWICMIWKKDFPQEKGILVFSKGDNLEYIAFSERKEMDIISDIPRMDSFDVFVDFKMIYFSNTLTELNVDKFDVFLDYSMSNRFKEALVYDEILNNNRNPLIEYKRYEFNKQVDKMLEGVLEFPANYIQMKIEDISLIKIGDMLPKDCEDAIEDLNLLWEHYFCIEKGEFCRVQYDLIIELIRAFLYDMITRIITLENRILDKRRNSIFASLFKKIVSNESVSGNTYDIKRACRWVQKFLKDLAYDFNIELEKSHYNIGNDEEWANSQDSIDEYFKMIIQFTQEDKAKFWESWKTISIHKNGTSSIRQINLQENIEDFLRFWNAYRRVSYCIDSIYFCWDISSGEENRLNLFSALTEGFDKNNNIWLLLDEPDNTFHPQWSKSLIKEIVDLCTAQKNKTFQIWITTHSPLLLSDIPGPAVTYLESGELKKEKNARRLDKGIFGQNIYTLYNDAFFLKDGVIGDFASARILEYVLKLEKIERAISDNQYNLESIHEIIEECKKICELVAEPVFKKQMEYYLKSCVRLVERKERND